MKLLSLSASAVLALTVPLLAVAAEGVGRGPGPAGLASGDPAWRQAADRAREALKARYPAEAARVDRGVAQVLERWRTSDGDPAALGSFLEEEFLPTGGDLDRTFERFEFTLERTYGFLNSLALDLRRGTDLEIGPLLPLDRRLAAYEPSAHVSEDLFSNKIAFVALLNFPLTTLEERLEQGPAWTRRQWAETRLAQRFATRLPADVVEAATRAQAGAEAYIAGYNVHTHHLLTRDGQRLFPPGQRLVSHWNLRDEIKARYSEKDGLPAQRLLQKVMERIVTQEIPAAVIDNPLLDWTPETGRVALSPVKDAEPPSGRTADPRADREPDERYRHWLAMFHAARRADPYFSGLPTLVDRKFELEREIPEARVKALFEAVLRAPEAARVARLIEKRLGRPLEPFDVWYAGFKPQARHSPADLDALTRKRYPTARSYADDMPRLFRDLGFSEEKARFLADRIVVEPSRGPGHAAGAARRDDVARLRTRVGPQGMDFKGYNIAVHEMGHNVEQVFSTTTIDHTLLQGVPNTAFTEALAFVFQSRDLELLGLGAPDTEARALRALEELWASREIAAVGLIDMAAWRWLYAHPEATPAQFREAVVAAAREVWNTHFAPLFGVRDVPVLAVYSHFVYRDLYTPDYGLGHLIACQVEEHFRKDPGRLGAEFERMARLGSITPDAWMRQAVGSPLSAQPLLDAAARALAAVEEAPAAAGGRK